MTQYNPPGCSRYLHYTIQPTWVQQVPTRHDTTHLGAAGTYMAQKKPTYVQQVPKWHKKTHPGAAGTHTTHNNPPRCSTYLHDTIQPTWVQQVPTWHKKQPTYVQQVPTWHKTAHHCSQVPTRHKTTHHGIAGTYTTQNNPPRYSRYLHDTKQPTTVQQVPTWHKTAHHCSAGTHLTEHWPRSRLLSLYTASYVFLCRAAEDRTRHPNSHNASALKALTNNNNNVRVQNHPVFRLVSPTQRQTLQFYTWGSRAANTHTNTDTMQRVKVLAALTLQIPGSSPGYHNSTGAWFKYWLSWLYRSLAILTLQKPGCRDSTEAWLSWL
jgi:hypothetical protein